MSYQEKNNKIKQIKTNKGREGYRKRQRREVGKEAGTVEGRKEEGSKKETKKKRRKEKSLFWGVPKSLQMVIAAMKLKDTYSLERKL